MVAVARCARRFHNGGFRAEKRKGRLFSIQSKGLVRIQTREGGGGSARRLGGLAAAMKAMKDDGASGGDGLSEDMSHEAVEERKEKLESSKRVESELKERLIEKTVATVEQQTALSRMKNQLEAALAAAETSRADADQLRRRVDELLNQTNGQGNDSSSVHRAAETAEKLPAESTGMANRLEQLSAQVSSLTKRLIDKQRESEEISSAVASSGGEHNGVQAQLEAAAKAAKKELAALETSLTAQIRTLEVQLARSVTDEEAQEMRHSLAEAQKSAAVASAKLASLADSEQKSAARVAELLSHVRRLEVSSARLPTQEELMSVQREVRDAKDESLFFQTQLRTALSNSEAAKGRNKELAMELGKAKDSLRGLETQMAFMLTMDEVQEQMTEILQEKNTRIAALQSELLTLSTTQEERDKKAKTSVSSFSRGRKGSFKLRTRVIERKEETSKSEEEEVVEATSAFRRAPRGSYQLRIRHFTTTRSVGGGKKVTNKQGGVFINADESLKEEEKEKKGILSTSGKFVRGQPGTYVFQSRQFHCHPRSSRRLGGGDKNAARRRRTAVRKEDAFTRSAPGTFLHKSRTFP